MDKVVEKGIKIDLHIHSVFSRAKDGNKVKNNTIENLPVLTERLIHYGVEMCSITDHDTFNYAMYAELKKEEQRDNCIRKVLPGIEFSVKFVNDKDIHIVTIFDDKDDELVQQIEDIMTNGDGKKLYKNGAYEREDYLNILDQIGLDFVMIAHQKNSVTSQKGVRANDVMSLGEDVFNELVFMDYFDAYEFRNRKNEIYNKAYRIETSTEENLRFITGSDCHVWENYPSVQGTGAQDYKHTYIKSLPTFKGLAMAITDHHRISLENSFFNPNEKYIPELTIEIKGEEKVIPLSKGINVIIGDNSIGKSLLLDKITGGYKDCANSVRRGYSKYLEEHDVVVEKQIDEKDIFRFNGQGEIRKIFDEQGLKPDKYLQQFYPDKINEQKYREKVEKEMQRFYQALEEKFEYDEKEESLPKFVIPSNDLEEKSIIFNHEVKKRDIHEIKNIVDTLGKIQGLLEQLSENQSLLSEDAERLENILEVLKIMYNKYSEYANKLRKENEKINIFNTYMNAYYSRYNKYLTDENVRYAEFVEQKKNTIDGIAQLIRQQLNLTTYQEKIQEEQIVPEENPVGEYKFVSKIQIEKIDADYVKKVRQSVIKTGYILDPLTITKTDLKDMIKHYPSDEVDDPLQVLQEKITAKLDADFKVKNTIVQEKMDVFKEVSAGFDAQMYFALLSGEIRDKGIYIIDQPEDHISQSAIKRVVLDYFRRMGGTRQVIMVTHNPQFIVNLDVDNVIYLYKDEEEIAVQSGALEYEDSGCDILRIVADNIEGGLTTIQRRMKRYEKNI